MNIQYRHPNGEEGLIYTDFATMDDGGAIISPKVNFFDLKQSSHLIRHSFPKGLTWTPDRIEINGRKGRRAVCVLAQDALHYRVYDLDSTTNDEVTMEIADD